MTYQEAEVLMPLATLFDRLYEWAKVEPLRVDSPMTKQEALDAIKMAKQMALINTSTKPAYNVFQYTLKSLHNTVLEGRGPCAFDPMLCVWMQNSQSILKSLKE